MLSQPSLSQPSHLLISNIESKVLLRAHRERKPPRGGNALPDAHADVLAQVHLRARQGQRNPLLKGSEQRNSLLKESEQRNPCCLMITIITTITYLSLWSSLSSLVLSLSLCFLLHLHVCSYSLLLHVYCCYYVLVLVVIISWCSRGSPSSYSILLIVIAAILLIVIIAIILRVIIAIILIVIAAILSLFSRGSPSALRRASRTPRHVRVYIHIYIYIYIHTICICIYIYIYTHTCII